jgi:hypothetical protein
MAQSGSIRTKTENLPGPVCGCIEEVVLLLPQYKSHRNRHDGSSQHFSPALRQSHACGWSESDGPIFRLQAAGSVLKNDRGMLGKRI